MIVILVPAHTNSLLQNTLFHKMGNKSSPKCASLITQQNFLFIFLPSLDRDGRNKYTCTHTWRQQPRAKENIFKYTLQLLTLSNITEAKYQLLFSLQLIHNFLI